MAFQNPYNKLIYHEILGEKTIPLEAEDYKSKVYGDLALECKDLVILEGSKEAEILQQIKDRLPRIRDAIKH